MRVRLFLPIAVAATLILPASASADFGHVIASGESLTSIAALDGLTVGQLAAANGLSSTSELTAGSVVQIPSQAAGLAQAAPVSSASDPDADGDTDSSATTAGVTAAPVSAGSYVVQPGDTLSAIAARAGVSVDALAAANGLDPAGLLVSGTALQLAGSSGSSSGSTAVTDPPYPTPERLSASQIANVAAANNVSPSLADAIAWQESGFNNDLVSSADARGIMQILPGTWQWIQNDLNPGTPLAPASAVDNVRGGVLMLRSLMNSTGGDPALTAAGYYQGLPSVQRHGIYPSTQQYINSVLALRQQFGGG